MSTVSPWLTERSTIIAAPVSRSPLVRLVETFGTDEVTRTD
ncbi:MAG: hypothetical protein ACTMUB_01235 [cyanobacterium endosymbiont of Rhopalodia musculus]|nr:hypothetical protein [cyanobacterium endosymbiont of Epithemia clementina EcSB]WGT66887.1 hypothetical protein P3F56_06450 [cyanobacterium endosymbiont of Epithemia clementina EcSB]